VSRDYRVSFTVPCEVVVTLSADDEETAADRAWELAQERLQTAAVPDAAGTTLHGDLDGIGADRVEPA
jgi:hypothetical protein